MIKEGKTKRPLPSSFLEWCLEPWPLEVWVTGNTALRLKVQSLVVPINEMTNYFLAFHRFGRRIMLLVSYISGLLFAIASAFANSYMTFAVLRFFTGFCITGIVIVSTVLSNYMFIFLISVPFCVQVVKYNVSCCDFRGFSLSFDPCKASCSMQVWSGWTLSTGNWSEWSTAFLGHLGTSHLQLSLILSLIGGYWLSLSAHLWYWLSFPGGRA